MALMLAGLLLFFATHLMQVVQPLRAGAVAALGQAGYRVGYSVLALAGLVLIIVGYGAWRDAGPAVLYVPPAWLAHIALLLLVPTFVLLVAAYTPSHIRKAVRHPMITAVKLWAFAHLLANGDAASVVLFGAFLAWGVVDRISLKRRERAGLITPAAFEPRWRADAVAIVVGLAIYALFVWNLHLLLIGVSPIAIAM